jgi:flagellar export protein FliJ
MKKFSFNLEVLRKHRHMVEEQERIKFAAIHFQLQDEHQHLQDLRNQQWNTIALLTEKNTGKYDSQEIAWFYSYLDHLSKEMNQSSERISKLRGELDQQRQVLVGATRDMKMLDNLRNKKEKEFKVAQQRLEQKSVDEIVVTRFAHRAERV